MEQVNFRQSKALGERLTEFCSLSRRRAVDVVRDSVELLLADGYTVAERRLSAGVFDLDGGRQGTEKPTKRRGGKA